MIDFGKIRDTKVNGNTTETIEKNYRNRQVALPIRRYVEERVRVENLDEEHRTYLEFSDWVHANKKTIRDAAFRIEHQKTGDAEGYWFVIKSFTRLEYTEE